MVSLDRASKPSTSAEGFGLGVTGLFCASAKTSLEVDEPRVSISVRMKLQVPLRIP